MPNKEFLEDYSLYRKCELDLPQYMFQLPRPPIHISCSTCGSDQTFNMQNKWGQESLSVSARMLASAPALPSEEGREADLPGFVGKAIYQCSACGSHHKTFLLHFDKALAWVMKVGEFPAGSIKISKPMSKFLGGQSDHFRKGLMCEAHAFGIAAFAYYRRVVECTMQNLLEDMLDLLQGTEKDAFAAEVSAASQMKNATDKLALVKNRIPSVLRPGGRNPISILHSVLSEGIHNKTDEECLETANQVKAVLVFVIETVQSTRAAQASYAEELHKLSGSSS